MPEIKPPPASDLVWEGDQDDPGSVKKAAGWAAAEKPAHNHFNWLFGEHYNWIEWLKEIGARVFSEIGTAIDTLNPGDMFRLAPSSVDGFLASEGVHITTSGYVGTFCCDGLYHYLWDSQAQVVRCYRNLNGFQSLIWENEEINNQESCLKIHTDGDLVALLFGRDGGSEPEVFIFRCSDGVMIASAHTTDASEQAEDILVAGNGSGESGRAVYWSDGDDLMRWTPGGGTVTWQSAIGYVKAITANPDWIFAVTVASSTPSLATLRRYRRSNGAAGPVDAGIAAGENIGWAAACCDGDHVYTACYLNSPTEPMYLEKYSTWGTDGASPSFPVWGGPIGGYGSTAVGAGARVYRICVDDRYVYFKNGATYLVIRDKVSGAILFQMQSPEGEILDLDTDGQHLYVARADEPYIWRRSTQRSGGMWIVADAVGGDNYITAGVRRLPFQKMALPITR